jgi:hypothetical protein
MTDQSTMADPRFSIARISGIIFCMTLQEFNATLSLASPPKDLHPILAGLWYDARGDWHTAHTIAQGSEGTREYDRLHAYLHRKEGDDSNARYWYRRSGEAVFNGSLQQEWDELAKRYCKG